MNKLSKREKLLIFLLLLIVLVAGGLTYVIAPLDDKISAAEDDIAAQEMTAQEMKTTIETGETLSDIYEENKSALETELSRYYEYMDNDAISDLVTNMVQNAGLQVQALSIGDTAFSTVTGYLSAEGTAGATMLTNSVTATVTGSLDNLVVLVDRISGNDSMSLVSFSASSGGSGASTYAVALTIYMRG